MRSWGVWLSGWSNWQTPPVHTVDSGSNSAVVDPALNDVVADSAPNSAVAETTPDRQSSDAAQSPLLQRLRCNVAGMVTASRQVLFRAGSQVLTNTHDAVSVRRTILGLDYFINVCRLSQIMPLLLLVESQRSITHSPPVLEGGIDRNNIRQIRNGLQQNPGSSIVAPMIQRFVGERVQRLALAFSAPQQRIDIVLRLCWHFSQHRVAYLPSVAQDVSAAYRALASGSDFDEDDVTDWLGQSYLDLPENCSDVPSSLQRIAVRLLTAFGSSLQPNIGMSSGFWLFGLVSRAWGDYSQRSLIEALRSRLIAMDFEKSTQLLSGVLRAVFYSYSEGRYQRCSIGDLSQRFGFFYTVAMNALSPDDTQQDIDYQHEQCVSVVETLLADPAFYGAIAELLPILLELVMPRVLDWQRSVAAGLGAGFQQQHEQLNRVAFLEQLVGGHGFVKLKSMHANGVALRASLASVLQHLSEYATLGSRNDLATVSHDASSAAVESAEIVDGGQRISRQYAVCCQSINGLREAIEGQGELQELWNDAARGGAEDVDMGTAVMPPSCRVLLQLLASEFLALSAEQQQQIGLQLWLVLTSSGQTLSQSLLELKNDFESIHAIWAKLDAQGVDDNDTWSQALTRSGLLLQRALYTGGDEQGRKSLRVWMYSALNRLHDFGLAHRVNNLLTAAADDLDSANLQSVVAVLRQGLSPEESTQQRVAIEQWVIALFAIPAQVGMPENVDGPANVWVPDIRVLVGPRQENIAGALSTNILELFKPSTWPVLAKLKQFLLVSDAVDQPAPANVISMAGAQPDFEQSQQSAADKLIEKLNDLLIAQLSRQDLSFLGNELLGAVHAHLQIVAYTWIQANENDLARGQESLSEPSALSVSTSQALGKMLVGLQVYCSPSAMMMDYYTQLEQILGDLPEDMVTAFALAIESPQIFRECPFNAVLPIRQKQVDLKLWQWLTAVVQDSAFIGPVNPEFLRHWQAIPGDDQLELCHAFVQILQNPEVGGIDQQFIGVLLSIPKIQAALKQALSQSGSNDSHDLPSPYQVLQVQQDCAFLLDKVVKLLAIEDGNPKRVIADILSRFALVKLESNTGVREVITSSAISHQATNSSHGCVQFSGFRQLVDQLVMRVLNFLQSGMLSDTGNLIPIAYLAREHNLLDFNKVRSLSAFVVSLQDYLPRLLVELNNCRAQTVDQSEISVQQLEPLYSEGRQLLPGLDQLLSQLVGQIHELKQIDHVGGQLDLAGVRELICLHLGHGSEAKVEAIFTELAAELDVVFSPQFWLRCGLVLQKYLSVSTTSALSRVDLHMDTRYSHGAVDSWFENRIISALGLSRVDARALPLLKCIQLLKIKLAGFYPQASLMKPATIESTSWFVGRVVAALGVAVEDENVLSLLDCLQHCAQDEACFHALLSLVKPAVVASMPQLDWSNGTSGLSRSFALGLSNQLRHTSGFGVLGDPKVIALLRQLSLVCVLRDDIYLTDEPFEQQWVLPDKADLEGCLHDLFVDVGGYSDADWQAFFALLGAVLSIDENKDQVDQHERACVEAVFAANPLPIEPTWYDVLCAQGMIFTQTSMMESWLSTALVNPTTLTTINALVLAKVIHHVASIDQQTASSAQIGYANILRDLQLEKSFGYQMTLLLQDMNFVAVKAVVALLAAGKSPRVGGDISFAVDLPLLYSNVRSLWPAKTTLAASSQHGETARLSLWSALAARSNHSQIVISNLLAVAATFLDDDDAINALGRVIQQPELLEQMLRAFLQREKSQKIVGDYQQLLSGSYQQLLVPERVNSLQYLLRGVSDLVHNAKLDDLQKSFALCDDYASSHFSTLDHGEQRVAAAMDCARADKAMAVCGKGLDFLQSQLGQDFLLLMTSAPVSPVLIGVLDVIGWQWLSGDAKRLESAIGLHLVDPLQHNATPLLQQYYVAGAKMLPALLLNGCADDEPNGIDSQSINVIVQLFDAVASNAVKGSELDHGLYLPALLQLVSRAVEKDVYDNVHLQTILKLILKDNLLILRLQLLELFQSSILVECCVQTLQTLACPKTVLQISQNKALVLAILHCLDCYMRNPEESRRSVLDLLQRMAPITISDDLEVKAVRDTILAPDKISQFAACLQVSLEQDDFGVKVLEYVGAESGGTEEPNKISSCVAKFLGADQSANASVATQICRIIANPESANIGRGLLRVMCPVLSLLSAANTELLPNDTVILQQLDPVMVARLRAGVVFISGYVARLGDLLREEETIIHLRNLVSTVSKFNAAAASDESKLLRYQLISQAGQLLLLEDAVLLDLLLEFGVNHFEDRDQTGLGQQIVEKFIFELYIKLYRTYFNVNDYPILNQSLLSLVRELVMDKACCCHVLARVQALSADQLNDPMCVAKEIYALLRQYPKLKDSSLVCMEQLCGRVNVTVISSFWGSRIVWMLQNSFLQQKKNMLKTSKAVFKGDIYGSLSGGVSLLDQVLPSQLAKSSGSTPLLHNSGAKAVDKNAVPNFGHPGLSARSQFWLAALVQTLGASLCCVLDPFGPFAGEHVRRVGRNLIYMVKNIIAVPVLFVELGVMMAKACKVKIDAALYGQRYRMIRRYMSKLCTMMYFLCQRISRSLRLATGRLSYGYTTINKYFSRVVYVSAQRIYQLSQWTVRYSYQRFFITGTLAILLSAAALVSLGLPVMLTLYLSLVSAYVLPVLAMGTKKFGCDVARWLSRMKTVPTALEVRSCGDDNVNVSVPSRQLSSCTRIMDTARCVTTRLVTSMPRFLVSAVRGLTR